MPDSHWTIDEFMDHLEVERGFTEQSLDAYKGDLEAFFEFLARRQEVTVDKVDIAGVKPRDIRRYLRECKDRGNCNRTLNRRLVVLRTFFAFLSDEEDGILEKDPAKKLKNLKIEKRLPRYLTKPECEDFLECIRLNGVWPARDHAILLILMQCGCRASELVALSMEDIYFDQEMIRFWGKGRKERLVPLLKRTANAIRAYLCERKPKMPTKRLFITRKGRPLTVGGLATLFPRLLERWPNRKPGVSLHKMRHTCFTLLLRAGVDLRSIQEIAGHASISTTELYTHVSKEQLAEVMGAHPLAKRSLDETGETGQTEA